MTDPLEYAAKKTVLAVATPVAMAVGAACPPIALLGGLVVIGANVLGAAALIGMALSKDK